MDCTNLQYEDNVFDTVVDTFGLQSSHDYEQQYKEMKRVCKVN
jgi:ubiquinone/menaquinone biosynthesis C-methylase UbiE